MRRHNDLACQSIDVRMDRMQRPSGAVKIFEYMACRKPVNRTPRTNATIAKDGKKRLDDTAGDHEALASATARLIRDLNLVNET